MDIKSSKKWIDNLCLVTAALFSYYTVMWPMPEWWAYIVIWVALFISANIPYYSHSFRSTAIFATVGFVLMQLIFRGFRWMIEAYLR